MSNRETQRTRILDLLRSHEGEWVPLSEILDLRIGQYNARVFELRRLGFAIENRTERDDSGTVHSSFRLVTSSPRLEQARGDASSGSEPDYARRTRELHDQAMPLFAGVRRA